ncbi:oxygenase MpaB family protein [Usitatibacter palustris]|uniref:oxygenase MpaB family protein n=1 Tax=Usitatibacter palustris TaxID=2732487 RepID=UPI001BB13CFB|nr:oxygenase MpaB family protein [Usitatibacter palustris]
MATQARSIPGEEVLEAHQWIADPHADAAVAAILGPWTGEPPVDRIDALNAAIRSWQDNASVANGQAAAGSAPDVAAALKLYLSVAKSLPEWAEPARIARAEAMFMDQGALSVTVLFCASLPECYVIPDLASVLHATGQLEDRAEHRIRTTGAMIFPVMMRGGLTTPNGAGIAQVLKVRLIHAMIRNLILRGPPDVAVARMRFMDAAAPGGVIPCLGRAQPGDSMHHALFLHGWDLAGRALPNNQEELAYTLLTFSYVYLRSLRRLGIGYPAEAERDYLHAWNVAGHFLGIERALMVDSMEEAEELFARMQARGREHFVKHPLDPDPRPSLGGALMAAMQSVIPDGPLKPFPVLLTRRLMEKASARELGLDGRVSWISKVMFSMLMRTSRVIDAVVRVGFPEFSISRLVTRVIGYRLTCALLMSQTRELSVPGTLRPGIRSLIASWGQDTHAPKWMNAIEDKLTTSGEWKGLGQ